jgi:hypothetical protein
MLQPGFVGQPGHQIIPGHDFFFFFFRRDPILILNQLSFRLTSYIMHSFKTMLKF